jgi:hypothetical protein
MIWRLFRGLLLSFLFCGYLIFYVWFILPLKSWDMLTEKIMVAKTLSVPLKEKSAITMDNAFPKPTLMKQRYSVFFFKQIFLT